LRLLEDEVMNSPPSTRIARGGEASRGEWRRCPRGRDDADRTSAARAVAGQETTGV